jgi:hypothetical protein
MVNDADAGARRPDPRRMLRGYSQAAATLNLLRAFSTGGYAALQRISQWNLDFVPASKDHQACRYCSCFISFSRVSGAFFGLPRAFFLSAHRIPELSSRFSTFRVPRSFLLGFSTSSVPQGFLLGLAWLGFQSLRLGLAHLGFSGAFFSVRHV